jgi:hypothetical protein
MLALRATAERQDEKRTAPELEQQVAGDEQPRAIVERVVDRDRHDQAREHQPDERGAPAAGPDRANSPPRDQYQAYKTASTTTTVSAPVWRSRSATRCCESCPIAKT